MNEELIKQLTLEKQVWITKISELEKFVGQLQEAKNKVIALDTVINLYNNDSTHTLSDMTNEKNITSFEYDSNLTWADKCLVVLKQIKEGYSTDVAKKLREFEPSLTEDKALGIASFQLSNLLKDGKIIKVSQSGRKYKFGIK